jgi:hypothetical protein
MRVDWFDGASVAASALCLIHCLALPVLLASAPAASALFGSGETVHLVLLLLAAPTSAGALLLSFRQHRHSLPPIAGCVGLALLTSALCLASSNVEERIMTLAGSIILAAAHVSNWHLRRRGAPNP